MLRYKVTEREYAIRAKTKTLYEGPDITIALQVHDEAVNVTRMTGPIVDFSIEVIWQTEGKHITGYLQTTQVKGVQSSIEQVKEIA